MDHISCGYVYLTPLPAVELLDGEWLGVALECGAVIVPPEGGVELTAAVPATLTPAQARDLAAALLAVARRAEEGTEPEREALKDREEQS